MGRGRPKCRLRLGKLTLPANTWRGLAYCTANLGHLVVEASHERKELVASLPQDTSSRAISSCTWARAKRATGAIDKIWMRRPARRDGAYARSLGGSEPRDQEEHSHDYLAIRNDCRWGGRVRDFRWRYEWSSAKRLD